MNKAGIEVHEIQKPRPRPRKPKPNLDDVEPITREDVKAIGLCIAGTAAFWAVVIWVFW